MPDRGLRHRQIPPAHRPWAPPPPKPATESATPPPPPPWSTNSPQAADEKTLSRAIARHGRIDLLCPDELGYLELDRRGAELLFGVFTEREERASVEIASNAAFSEWTGAFTDPRLCAAIVDRLTFDAHIIQTGSDSHRLRATTQRRATNEP